MGFQMKISEAIVRFLLLFKYYSMVNASWWEVRCLRYGGQGGHSYSN